MDNCYLDDASRLIVGYGVFENAITENAIKVLKEAMDNYGKPESILTDRGTQFYASAGEKRLKVSQSSRNSLLRMELSTLLVE